MKKLLIRVFVGLIALVLILVVGAYAWISLTWDKTYDDVEYPDLEVSTDPAVIERGRYLVHGPAHCSNCHVGSYEEAMRADAGEDIPMAGGWTFEMGPLGSITTANLTSDEETGLGRYSDGEVFRMLRHNVKPDGHTSIAPMMPFANMADEDLIAIVSYLRTLPPVRNEVPGPEWGFMGKMVLAIRPVPFEPIVDHDPPAVAPPMEATVERGEYVARYVANCWGCHSPINPMNFELEGPEFSGNMRGERTMDDPDVLMRMPNLTPHETGVLDNFPDEDAWVARFRAGRQIPESFMHWGPFSRMSEEDLRALYRFFNSLEPVDNEVAPIMERVN